MADRNLIGKEHPIPPAEIERGKMRELILAIDDPNPIYIDGQAAQGEGYRDMPASPTFITVPILWAGVNQEVVKSLGVDFAKLLVAGEAYEYLQEIYTGDVLTGKVSVTEIADKTGKTGIMEFITLETVFVNQNGQEVIKVFTSLVERK